MNRNKCLSLIFITIILSTSIIPVYAWDAYQDLSTYVETDIPNKGTLVNDFYVLYEDWDSNLYGDGALHWIGVIDQPKDFVATFGANFSILVNGGGNLIHRFFNIYSTTTGDADILLLVDKTGAPFNYNLRVVYDCNEFPAQNFVQGTHVYTYGNEYWFRVMYNGLTIRVYSYVSEAHMRAQQNPLDTIVISPVTMNNVVFNRVQINKPLAVAQTYRRWGHFRLFTLGSPIPTIDPIFEDFVLDGFNLNSSVHSGYFNFDDYLYKGEVYNLTVRVTNTTYAKVNFTDGENTINFEYWNYTINNQTDVFRVSATDRYVVSELAHFVTRVNFTYSITWTFILGDNIVDSRPYFNIYLTRVLPNGTLRYSNYLMCQIGIYNLGGFVAYEFGGDGYKDAYADVFEIGATDGSTNSYAYAEIIFKRLQHVNMLVELDLDNEWAVNEFDLEFGAGSYQFGIDYYVNYQWVNGWYASMYPVDGDVGHHGLGDDHNWLQWSIDWYNLDPLTNTTINLKTDTLYSNHNGYDTEQSTNGFTNRTTAQFWIDLWYSNRNSSTVVSGRVNSYYYGMYEQGNAFWFGYGKFRPMTSDNITSIFYDDLYDDRNKVTNCQKFTLMRFWVKVDTVNIADANDETWSIKFAQNPNFKQADDRMMGVETPILHETKVLDMPQTGFLTPLQRAIEGISKAIWLGALGFIRLLWGAMDTLLEFMGFPANTFSNIISFILTIPTYLNSFLLNLPFISTNLLSAITQVFSVFTVTIPRYLYGLGLGVSIFIQYIRQFVSLFTGGWANVNNIWASWNLVDWIQLFLVFVLPFRWLQRIDDSDNKFNTVRDDLSFAYKLFIGVLDLLINLVKTIIAIIGGIKDVLPI